MRKPLGQRMYEVLPLPHTHTHTQSQTLDQALNDPLVKKRSDLFEQTVSDERKCFMTLTPEANNYTLFTVVIYKSRVFCNWQGLSAQYNICASKFQTKV